MQQIDARKYDTELLRRDVKQIYKYGIAFFGKNTKAEDPIWIRADKLDYARKHRFENEEFFVVNYKFADVWYVIHYNNELIEHIRATKEKTDFRTIHPFIKRCRETFVEIDSQSKYVQDLSYLKKYLEMQK